MVTQQDFYMIVIAFLVFCTMAITLMLLFTFLDFIRDREEKEKPEPENTTYFDLTELDNI